MQQLIPDAINLIHNQLISDICWQFNNASCICEHLITEYKQYSWVSKAWYDRFHPARLVEVTITMLYTLTQSLINNSKYFAIITTLSCAQSARREFIMCDRLDRLTLKISNMSDVIAKAIELIASTPTIHDKSRDFLIADSLKLLVAIDHSAQLADNMTYKRTHYI